MMSIIYDYHIFTVQAIDFNLLKTLWELSRIFRIAQKPSNWFNFVLRIAPDIKTSWRSNWKFLENVNRINLKKITNTSSYSGHISRRTSDASWHYLGSDLARPHCLDSSASRPQPEWRVAGRFVCKHDDLNVPKDYSMPLSNLGSIQSLEIDLKIRSSHFKSNCMNLW
jgi:hypothetical protein